MIKKLNLFLTIMLIACIFSLGYTSAYLVMLSGYNVEKPFSYNKDNNSFSPSDFIKESDIRIYSDRIIIYLDDARISRYAPTGSMLPILDSGANGIKITPLSENEVNVGDIITFRSGNDLIVHRVVEKGKDNQGTYFITKGDNNLVSDGKIRFSSIESKTVGVLY